jgi:hypothetical protein
VDIAPVDVSVGEWAIGEGLAYSKIEYVIDLSSRNSLIEPERPNANTNRTSSAGTELCER